MAGQRQQKLNPLLLSQLTEMPQRISNKNMA
jgi:hypothetical protein